MNKLAFGGTPQVAFTKFQSRLAETEKSGFAAKVNQLGINMVDLMMWLVIAALLLAAALQGIGFYQKAAWNYQLKSDADAVRTYIEAQYTLTSPNLYPELVAATPPADLKFTTSNGFPNTAVSARTTTGGWTATVCSGALKKAGVTNSAISISSADPAQATAVPCPAPPVGP